MALIRSDLVGAVYLPGGACLYAGDPVPPGEVVGAHLIEDGEPTEPVIAVEPAEPTEPVVAVEPTEPVEPEHQGHVHVATEPVETEEPAVVAEPVETVEPKPTTTSRTRRRSNGRAR